MTLWWTNQRCQRSRIASVSVSESSRCVLASIAFIDGFRRVAEISKTDENGTANWLLRRSRREQYNGVAVLHARRPNDDRGIGALTNPVVEA
jgi:hypothetical protein